MYNFPTIKLLKRLAIFSHRWTGAVFCLLFSWWFISGIFMMYFDYPEVNEANRLSHAQPLDASQVRLSPAEVWEGLKTRGEPDEVTLQMFDRRPTYWFRLGGLQKIVYADTGQVQTAFPPELNLRTAAAWSGQPADTAKIEKVISEDQWTVGGLYRNYAPLTKYSWPNGDEVYVSGVRGQVVQATTRLSRIGAWLGPIPHWLYFTPLRKNGRLWSRIVIWLSGAATVVAILGLIAGLSMVSPRKRYRSRGVPTSVPYAGPKRLHMILGLFFGVLACTWAFSGMLSMDPFPSQTTDDSGAASRIPEALNGEPFAFARFAAKHPRDALAQVAGNLKIKQLEFLTFAGEPFYLATEDSRHSVLIPVEGDQRTGFDVARLIDIVKKAARPEGFLEARLITQYDAYYLDRTGELPLPVLRVRMNDRNHTTLYIDPRTARIVGGYSSAMWAERWLYHGFHSINLPWLYNHRPAWDIVVMTLMLGGTSLCVTSAIIGWRLIRRRGASQRSLQAVS
jgi:PepSY-associated TM region